MPQKLLIIAGAPEAKDLDWEHDALLEDLIAPFAHLASFRLPEILQNADALPSPAQADDPVWRSIPLQRSRLPTGFSQHHSLHDAYRPDADFISTVTPSFRDMTELSTDFQQTQDGFLEQLYEQSLVLHDDSTGSQLQPESFSTTESYIIDSQDITTTDNPAQRPDAHAMPAAKIAGEAHLSDLEDLPKATYLESISPQTMTVNLIAGIISIAEPRTVKTRWGTTKSLVEMLLGDETKSGFSVTFWLSQNSRGKTKAGGASTESVLRGLRRQDVILLRNVALGTYAKKVHGHSLHNDITKVHLLHRRKLDRSDTYGIYTAKEMVSRRSPHPQLAKARKVWEWTISFVGEGEGPLGKRKAKGRPLRSWEMPPPDTQ